MQISKYLLAWLIIPMSARLLAQESPATIPQGMAELSIQDAIERSMTRSPSVAQAEAERDAQREGKRASYARLGPSVNVQYRENHYGEEQSITIDDNRIIIRDDVAKNGSLIVTQPLTGLYAIAQYARLGSMQEDYAEEGLRRSRSDAGFGGAMAFLQAYETQEQVHIAEASVAAARSAHQDAQVLARVGRLNQADLLKFQLALSQAETRASQARAAKAIAFVALRQSLQLSPQEEIVLKRDLPEVQEMGSEQDIEAVMQNRPELKQAEIGVEIAAFNRQAAYAEFVPSVNAFAQVDRNFGEVSGFGSQKETKYYGIYLQWDVWNNGRSIFTTRQAGAQRLKAEAALVQAKDALRLDITQSQENYKAAKESLKQAEAAVAQAEEAYRIDQLRFKNGQISATDLIQSETSRTQARGQRVSARTQYLGWYLRLQRSQGAEKPVI